MSLDLCILASGSGGNCAILRGGGAVLLIDAGLAPRTLARRLDGTGVRLDDVRAICLTHLDHDHLSARWLKPIVQRRIPVYCHESAAEELAARARMWEMKLDLPGHARRLASLLHVFDGDAFAVAPGLSAAALRLAHDRDGSSAFVFEGDGCRIGYATDVGHVPPALLEHFADLDVLAIESNYDPQMQLGSRRPWFLKHRIMGGSGHLSNDQAFDAVRRILDRAETHGRPLPAHIALLHRSRQCNCPELLRRFFSRDRRIAPRLTLAHQHQRTRWLTSRPRPALLGEQLQMQWS